MQLDELTLDERQILFGLLSHLAEADQTIDPREVAELEALGEEMGMVSVQGAIRAARGAFSTADSALRASVRIERTDARELIRTVLHDLASADGSRSPEEEALLLQLDALWRPEG